MRRHLRYLSYVLRHKWFVLVEGLKLRVPIWQLILHDWSKFLPSEWFPYAATFYASNGEKQHAPTPAFDRAWNSHEKKHKHHWQYWVLVKDSGEQVPLLIPDRHRREMLADWRGAGRALGKPDTAEWYRNNRDHIVLHPETRQWVELQLGVTDTLREAIADVQHAIWSHWMEYLFAVCDANADADDDRSATIPKEKVIRWKRQMETQYNHLPSTERYSDLEQADKVLDVLRKFYA